MIEPMLFDGPALRSDWPWGELRPGVYGMIMVDPPWHFSLYCDVAEGRQGETAPLLFDETEIESEAPFDVDYHPAWEKSPQAHYRTMGLEEIARLPVGELAASDCLLWLWATAPMIDQQIAVAARWGFTFKTSGVWVKTTAHGRLGFGTGYLLRSAHEPFIVATRGRPRTSRGVRSVIMAPAREHSRKPDEAFRAAEALVPDVPRLELFSRQSRSGWDTWGDESGKFD